MSTSEQKLGQAVVLVYLFEKEVLFDAEFAKHVTAVERDGLVEVGEAERTDEREQLRALFVLQLPELRDAVALRFDWAC